MHTCPHPECEAMVTVQMFACKRHWFQLPKDIRSQIWQEYKREPGSPAHVSAMQAAMAHLEARPTLP